MNKILSIIIPAYNEEATLYALLEKVQRVELVYDFKKEIIVINDGSTDNTAVECKRFIHDFPETEVVLLEQSNQGKGAALRTGIAKANGEWTIIQDADLEYDPEDYNPLLQWAVDHNQPVVYGSRFLNKANKHSYYSFYLGGRLLSVMSNILFCQRLTDEPTCYKLFRTELLQSIPLRCTGFEFCPEVTAKVAKKGIKIKELPIRYYPRSVAEGKKINWLDGVEGIWVLIKYRFTN